MTSKHVPERHANCRQEFCQICDGGITACTRCGLAEGALTTECPGENVPYDRANDIYAGKVDFRGGQWVPGDGHMPWHNHELQVEQVTT
jgi:hypothetical protein